MEKELTFLFLAPFVVLTGIVVSGVLFDRWYKDPVVILKYAAITYAAIICLRIFTWLVRSWSR